MIIGFLGKGGSGKSSVATQMALWLHDRGKNVLAIDADHNMDLTFNLAGEKEKQNIKHIGSSLTDIKSHVGLESSKSHSDAFSIDRDACFFISEANIDQFTDKYSLKIKDRLRIMSAGPQTDEVLYGQSCSHILTTPLKIYLPLLKIAGNDEVIIDEKAGADGVTTGIVTGMDVAMIVCEPAVHSIKTAVQIAELLDFYGTPFMFVGNKISSAEDKDFLTERLGRKPAAFLKQSKLIQKAPDKIDPDWQKDLESIHREAAKINRDDRIARTRKKYERNLEFQPA